MWKKIAHGHLKKSTGHSNIRVLWLCIKTPRNDLVLSNKNNKCLHVRKGMERCTSPACQAISALWCTVPKWSLIHQRDKPAGRSGRLKRGGSEKIKKTVLYTLQYACQLILDNLLFSTLLLTFNRDHTDARVCVYVNWNQTSELKVIGFQFELERSAGHVTLSPRPVTLMSKRPQVSTAIAHYKPLNEDFFSFCLADLEPGGGE